MIKKSKIVVIHIDALRREYLSSWLLGQKLKQQGFSVLLTSRHSTHRLLNFFTPDILLLSHVFTLSLSLLKNLQRRGTKIFINEVEGVDYDLGVSTTYPEYHTEQKIDYNLFYGIFVWGEFSYQWILKNREINKKKLHLIGSIRQSKFCRPKKKNTKELVVGIISRFEIINPYDRRHPFDNLLTLDPEDENWSWWFERCSIDSETFSISFKLIRKLIKKGYKVSVRPHPNENLEAYDKLKNIFGTLFIVDNSNNINEWLSTVSVVFGPTSSAFTNAYLEQIPIISSSKIQNFYNIKHKEQADLLSRFDKASHTPASVKEAYNLCINPKLKPKKSTLLDDYFNKFYSLKNHVDPIENIINIIGNDAKHITQLKPKIINSFIIQYFFLFICDVLLVLKYLIFEKSLTKLKAINGYNYNRLFHRPSIFMKKLNRNIEH